jgi:hypothetical protein
LLIINSISGLGVILYVDWVMFSYLQWSADVTTAFTQCAAGKTSIHRFLLPPRTAGESSQRAQFSY